MKSILVFLFSIQAFADNCLRIDSVDSPQPVETMKLAETWCYRDFNKSGKSYRMVFNVDGEVSSEMAFLFNESNGQVSYGYQNNGESHLDLVESSFFNPLPDHVQKPLASGKFVKTKLKQKKDKDVRLVAQELLAVHEQKARVPGSYSIRAGNLKAYVADSALPYRGYWWPTRKLEMAKGSDSPMAIYDRSATKHFPDQTFRAYAWERRNHSSGTGWSGHCNGWAAASILNREPTQYMKDVRTGEVLSPSTQKAWLTESHYCMHNAFHGRRYRDRDDDEKDIAPDRFHKILIHYIKRQGKPVVFDIAREEPVYNHVVSGFNFDIRKRGSSRYRVTARVRIHSYDNRRNEKSGVAKAYTKTFRYDLRVRNGRIVSGKWRSRNNPDFIWVPLKAANCEGQNPYVTYENVQTMLSRLVKVD